jgi:PadR family transcriptional regulator PadR
LSKDKVSTVLTPKADLLQGTLDLLILKGLAAGPRHGWAVSKRIRQMSSEVLTVNQGSLYPALYRLEDRGWIASTEGLSPEGRRIRLYRLTAAGRRQLSAEIDVWRAFSTAVNRVVATE